MLSEADEVLVTECIFFAQNEADTSDDRLLAEAVRLKLSDEALLWAATRFGRASFVRNTIQTINSKLGMSHLNSLITANDYALFQCAVNAGHVAVIQAFADIQKRFDEEKSWPRQYSIASVLVIAGMALLDPTFKMSVLAGCLALLAKEASRTKDLSVNQMVISDNSRAFTHAVVEEQFDVIDKLITLAPTQVNTMVELAFPSLFLGKHTNVLEQLMEKAPIGVLHAIKNVNYESCEQSYPQGVEQLQKMILIKFEQAALRSDFDEMGNWSHIASTRWGDAIKSNMEEVVERTFIQAMSNRSLPCIKKLAGLSWGLQKNRLESQVDEVVKKTELFSHIFLSAVKDKNTNNMRELVRSSWVKNPEERIKDIRIHTPGYLWGTYQEDIFAYSIKQNSFFIVDALIELMPNTYPEKMSENYYKLYIQLKRHEQYKLLDSGSQYELKLLINKLLPYAFIDYEKNIENDRINNRENDYINLIVDNKLLVLNGSNPRIESTYRLDLFNVNDPEICRYMIRNLIRRDNANKVITDNILFLLNILSQNKSIDMDQVKTDLLIFSFEKLNLTIAAELLKHEAVRKKAEEHDFYGALSDIASKGSVEKMHQLFKLAPNNISSMIKHCDYEAFRFAVSKNDRAFIAALIKYAPAEVKAMISSNNYEALRTSHMDMLLHLFDLLETHNTSPADRETIIATVNFDLCRIAIERGRMDILERVNQFSPRAIDVINEQLKTQSVPVIERLMASVLSSSLTQEQKHIWMNRLLPHAFSHAESHAHEYSQYTHPFIDNQLMNLRALQTTFEDLNPHEVFDIDEAQAELCFYMIRNRIRQTPTQAFMDDICFLIAIPAVKALLHTEVTPGQPNELLQFAMSRNNQGAVGILNSVPAVRDLIQANRSHTRSQAQDDFRERSRESSMVALTSGEQNRLQRANDHYKPSLALLGVPRVMTMLREMLKKQYEANPAKIICTNGRRQILPLKWQDFQSIALSHKDKELALTAYYASKCHTAFRYLEKPNPWMSTNALYVNDERGERWSTFEEYQPLISMLFLAAKDEDIAPTDGFTVATRIEHFIDELAHIGRAHNWDKTRVIAGEKKEYDDLDGDKPSCYSGVKRRLFQSVQGHPLLKILTLDDIKQELRDFTREHFKQCIASNPQQAILWHTSWEELCNTGSGGTNLDELDISPEKQSEFIKTLSKKYPEQFKNDPHFVNYIQDRFKLTSSIKSHAVRFGGETDLTSLLHSYNSDSTEKNSI